MWLGVKNSIQTQIVVDVLFCSQTNFWFSFKYPWVDMPAKIRLSPYIIIYYNVFSQTFLFQVKKLTNRLSKIHNSDVLVVLNIVLILLLLSFLSYSNMLAHHLYCMFVLCLQIYFFFYIVICIVSFFPFFCVLNLLVIYAINNLHI